MNQPLADMLHEVLMESTPAFRRTVDALKDLLAAGASKATLEAWVLSQTEGHELMRSALLFELERL